MAKNYKGMHDKPLLKILIPFICGILLAIFFPGIQQISLFALSILIIILIPFTFFQNKNNFLRNTLNYNVILSLLILFLGVISVKIDVILQRNESLDTLADKKIWAEVSIDEMPSEGKNSMKSTVRLLKYKDSTDWQPIRGRFMLFLQKDSLSKALQYHDKLLLYITLSEVQEPKNPYQFDYKNYLANKKIYYMSYCSEGQWIKLDSEKQMNLFSMAYALRKKMLSIIESSNLNDKEKGLAAAFLLGWDEKVDMATLQSFSTAGISHLLCVSGLHVGIIFMLIGYSLFFLERTRKLRQLKNLLQLLLIWFFAMIAGFAPSVVRAATMLTFVTFAKLVNRKSNVYNNLAGAAWILLIIDPYKLLDVGFQLSFSAVLGIVAIQPLLVKLVNTRYKIINKIWDLACVSIAAQFATLPFTLYYFHQFPVYFLIANILIIPFAGFILGTALFLILFSFIPLINNVLEYLFSIQISFISRIVENIERFPHALISDVHFDIIHAILLALIILGFSWFFINKKRMTFNFSFVFFILFLSYSSIDYYIHSKQKQWIVYNINNKYSAVEFMAGNQSKFYSNDLVLADTSAKKFSIDGFRNGNRITHFREICITDTVESENNFVFQRKNFFKFCEDRILVYDKSFSSQKSNQKIELDFLILSDNPKIKIKELLSQFDFSTLIIDASNSNYRIQNWKNECDSLLVSYHDVKSTGAFVREIK